MQGYQKFKFYYTERMQYYRGGKINLHTKLMEECMVTDYGQRN
jgi:hypothetical protein